MRYNIPVMKKRNSKKLICSFIVLVLISCLCGCSINQKKEEKIPIRILLLPKFEIGEITGDLPGEAQFFYEAYLKDADEYVVKSDPSDKKLYVKDGLAMYILGMGKTNSAINMMAILNDERFDLSNAYIISLGCGGGAKEYATMGDIIVATSAIDYDLGHHADGRDLADQNGTSWFRNELYDDMAKVSLDKELTDKVFELAKDIKLSTTEETRSYLNKAFAGADWAIRDPKVQRGTTLSGDNYWKGEFGHLNALKMVEAYECPDPYAITEMEDVSIGLALKHVGKLDRYIIIRACVNTDVFTLNATPESVWARSEEIEKEAVEIFATAMDNELKVVDTIIKAINEGDLN